MDNCDTDVDVVASATSFTCDDVGNNAVTMTFTDDSGNEVECTPQFNVIDSSQPDAQCMDVTVQLDANGMAMLAAADADDGSQDNCPVSFSLGGAISYTCSDVGTSTNTLFVTDDSGLSE